MTEEKKLFAFRNLRMCSKECLCLYVCPTGATNTENSIIDATKCTGCGACAKACASGAISLVPYVYPTQQPHTEPVIAALRGLARKKTEVELSASILPGRLAKALERSTRVIAEDIMRETGYLLPQGKESQEFIADIIQETKSEAAKKLPELMK
ncbi:MAG TPA: 4Fe-4S binding protein [Methanocorpusculum sp.]|nr:4Fe-4S binding protein [Methanocorpusculum sp.]